MSPYQWATVAVIAVVVWLFVAAFSRASSREMPTPLTDAELADLMAQMTPAEQAAMDAMTERMVAAIAAQVDRDELDALNTTADLPKEFR